MYEEGETKILNSQRMAMWPQQIVIAAMVPTNVVLNFFVANGNAERECIVAIRQIMLLKSKLSPKYSTSHTHYGN